MQEIEAYRYRDKLSFKSRIYRGLWDFCYLVFIFPTPRWTLHRWRSTVLRLFGAKIGKGCRIDPSARIWAPWNVCLGDYVAIAQGVNLYAVDLICIGSKVAISQGAFICTASHNIRSLKRPLTHAPIKIGCHAWVAAEAMILPGVTVGQGAVISARTVLRKDADDWSIWAGNPARRVGSREILDNVE